MIIDQGIGVGHAQLQVGWGLERTWVSGEAAVSLATLIDRWNDVLILNCDPSGRLEVNK
jgi:hypothetical protein